MLREPLFLRRVLIADAVVSGACGVLMIAAANLLQALTNLPAAPMPGIGVFLLAYAGFVALIARRDPLPRAAVWLIVVINAMWVIDCIALLLSDWIQPNAFGVAFVVMQAVVVGIFAELQIIGLRRSAHAAHA